MTSDNPGLVRIEDEHLRYDGLDGAFIKLHIANLLLTLVTFGIYRFWARTRERRFVWGASSFLGDRFEYTGTGKELFIGFLKAMVVIALIFGLFVAAGLAAAILADGDEVSTPLYTQALSLPIYILLFYLVSFGAYSARRYRMSRTVWRGIRFEQTGSPFAYANQAFLGFVLCILTLGFYYPAYAMRLMRFQMNHLRFGTLQFGFDGTGKGILRAFLWLWAICGGFIILCGLAVLPMILRGEVYQLLAFIPLAYLLVLLVFPLSWAWFMSSVMRYAAEHTSAPGLAFSCTATGKKLFGLWFGNLLLMIFSFNLLRPMAVNRTMRFYARHYAVAGSVDLARIAAAPAGPRSGEGLAGYFDLDALPG